MLQKTFGDETGPYANMFLRERFTHILVKIAIHKQQGTNTSDNLEYEYFCNEAKKVLEEHPEWNDIANTWMSP